MAASSRPARTGSITTKVRVLAVVIIAAIGLYTAAWHYAAGRLEAAWEPREGASEGVEAECLNKDVRGFPFRIGMFCSQISVDDRRHGVSVTTGALRSAAQIYDPGHIVFDLEDPVVVRMANGAAVSGDWSSLRSSVRAGIDLPEQASLVAETLRVNVLPAVDAVSFVGEAAHAETHMRRNGDDLDLAVSADGALFSVKGQPPLLPPLKTTLDVSVTNGVAIVQDGLGDIGEALRGSEGQIRSFSADLGEGRTLALSGPFSVDQDGLVSGQIKLEMGGVDAWRQFLGESFPDEQSMIDTGAKLIRGLSGGGDGANVTLTIRNGAVMLGFIPVGTLPPL